MPSVVSYLPELAEGDVADEAAEHLDGRALCADNAVADHSGHHAEVADAPGLHPLVRRDKGFSLLVTASVMARVDVKVDERDSLAFAGARECAFEAGKQFAEASETW